jgi:hypothetical protein
LRLLQFLPIQVGQRLKAANLSGFVCCVLSCVVCSHVLCALMCAHVCVSGHTIAVAMSPCPQGWLMAFLKWRFHFQKLLLYELTLHSTRKRDFLWWTFFTNSNGVQLIRTDVNVSLVCLHFLLVIAVWAFKYIHYIYSYSLIPLLKNSYTYLLANSND